MKINGNGDLNTRFIIEISQITSPEVFIGIARVLRVELMKDQDTPKSFDSLLNDVLEAYYRLTRPRKKELLKILIKANKYRGEINGSYTKDSTETINN